MAENGTITVKQPADPNQGFWINDTQISTHSLEEILEKIKYYLCAIAIDEDDIPNLSEYGVSSITTEVLLDQGLKFTLKFTEYSNFELSATVEILTDGETGETFVWVEDLSHNITAVYRSPEITNVNDSISLDNGFANVLKSIDSAAYYNIANKLSN